MSLPCNGRVDLDAVGRSLSWCQRKSVDPFTPLQDHRRYGAALIRLRTRCRPFVNSDGLIWAALVPLHLVHKCVKISHALQHSLNLALRLLCTAARNPPYASITGEDDKKCKAHAKMCNKCCISFPLMVTMEDRHQL